MGNDAKITIEHLNINCHTGCFKVLLFAETAAENAHGHGEAFAGRRQIAPPLVAFRRRTRQLLRPCKNVFYNLFVCSVAETELNVFIVQRVQI